MYRGADGNMTGSLEQLLNELIEKHSRNGLNNESNEFSEEEVIQNKKLGKADDV